MSLFFRKYLTLSVLILSLLTFPTLSKGALNLKNANLKSFANQLEQQINSKKVNLGKLSLLSKIAVFNNVEINTPKLTLASSGGKEILFLSGTAKLFGKELAVICGITPSDDTEEDGPALLFFMGGVFPNQWSLIQAAPGFNKIPIFKDIDFSKVGLILANGDIELESKILPNDIKKFFENALGGSFDSLEAGEGLNFFGGLNFDKIALLKKVKELFALNPSLYVRGLVAKEIKDSYITVNLPSIATPSFFPKWFKGAQPSLTISGEPSVEVELPVTIILPPKSDKVTFLVKTKITENNGGALSLVGKMDGTWNNALGIKGFALEDLAIEGKTGLANPSLSIGMGGTFHIGEKEVRLAAILPLSPNISTLAFRGSINSIGIYDFINCANNLIKTAAKLANKKAVTIPLDKLPIPNIELRNVDINIAPAGGSKDLGIEDGLGFAGDLYINNKKLSSTMLRVSDEGVFIKQNIAPIKLGPLSLTGADGKEKQGPLLDLAISKNLSENHFFLSGKAKLLGLSKSILIEVSPAGYHFAFTDKVFDLYQAKVDALMKLEASNPDFHLYVEFENKILEELNGFVRNDLKSYIETIKKKLNEAKQNASKRLKSAEKKVSSARSKIQSLDKQIKDLQKDMSNKLKGPNKKLSDARKKVNSIKKQEDKAHKKYKSARKIKKPFYWGKYAAIKATRKTAEGVLRAAQASVNGIVKNLEPRIAALKTAKATANTVLIAAEKFLEGVRKSNNAILDAAKKLSDGVLKAADIITNPAIFNIEKVSFAGDLAQLKDMKSPKIDIKYQFLGKAYDLKIQADFSNVRTVAKALGKKIFDYVKKKI